MKSRHWLHLSPARSHRLRTAQPCAPTVVWYARFFEFAIWLALYALIRLDRGRQSVWVRSGIRFRRGTLIETPPESRGSSQFLSSSEAKSFSIIPLFCLYT